MKKYLFLFLLIFLGIFATLIYLKLNKRPPVERKFVQNIRNENAELNADEIPESTEENYQTNEESGVAKIDLKNPGDYVILKNNYHVYQTFNNCGPATLSMALGWYKINVSQEELASKMRPYQHPKGDNDDKTIFTYEFVDWAKKYGIEAIGRVNGDINLMKKFLSNGFPIVVKTWLKKGEDIGHFRFVTGYDDSKQLIFFDDSYDGPNRKMNYYDFLSLWQPFNYSYIVLYENDSLDTVKTIIGEDWIEKNSWKNALNRAEKENKLDPENIYPLFNISAISYHLEDYERSVKIFEQIESRLPKRMLWYQIEPIKSYQELGNYDRVFEISDNILENGNRSFSELYVIRGNIYILQGLKDKAREQFELALKYNEYMVDAKIALQNL